MREAESTTRQRMTARLREEALSLGSLATEFEVAASTAQSHVEHIAQSLDNADEQLLVAPPTCRECGFDEFDDLINRPSRCPDCKAENVEEPAFRIQ